HAARENEDAAIAREARHRLHDRPVAREVFGDLALLLVRLADEREVLGERDELRAHLGGARHEIARALEVLREFGLRIHLNDADSHHSTSCPMRRAFTARYAAASSVCGTTSGTRSTTSIPPRSSPSTFVGLFVMSRTRIAPRSRRIAAATS